MYILGINAYHGDSAACLVKNGKLVAAAEEERFRRVKHWAGFPSEAVRYCLAEEKIRLEDMDRVAVNTDPKANLRAKLGYTVSRRPDFRLILDRVRNAKERLGVEDRLRTAFPGQGFAGKVCYVEHHRAHLASAFIVSPFEQAVVASVDGFGDFASAAWGMGRGTTIDVGGRVYFPHSLGIFYQAMTQYLGFPHYGDEYKVMGLAPYGTPAYLQQMRKIVGLEDDGSYRLDLSYFRHHCERIEYEWDHGSPSVGILYTPALEDLLGPSRREGSALDRRHRDIARSVQAMYEEAFFHLLGRLHSKYHVDALALAGGCAMNSVANGKVYRNSPFKRLYVQSAAGDAGGAIGAAFAVWHRENAGAERFPVVHASWGPAFSDTYIRDLLGERGDELQRLQCRFEYIDDEGALCARTADALADGAVVGWFQGRMEWGPRALGNRSILGDPRRPDMKDILNRKIKRRESFRPFAPSILREAAADWFETDDDVPFMMQVYQVREDKRQSIPAVVHVDGSGRLQTVSAGANPRYHRLIKAFERRTGVPMVLNTSFNENEPVVCKPQEALDCFLRTKMDVLVMGDWLLRRVSDT